jgi:paraquat-inducible protein B
MNRPNPQAGDDLPKAKTTRRKWSSYSIWIVPILAALVAGSLVYQHVREYGNAITLKFRTSGGVKAGETPVRYRGADIGQVTAVALSSDLQYADVKIKLRRSASSVAREGSIFWIMRPQLEMGLLSGLGTIVTGPYIEVLPGPGKAANSFMGSDISPEVLDPDGLKIILLAGEGGSLRAGVPIYYRGIEVGIIRETRLGTNAAFVEIGAVIRKRYAPLVRTDSKFWNVTGLDLRVGLFHGAEVNVESLKSLLIGGIAFATPENERAKPAEEGMVFRLYEKAQKEWSSWSPSIAIPLEDTDRAQARVDEEAKIEFPQQRNSR